ncbi:MAG: DUF3943 domain-containing protein, partial [bacterium]|nr:DUF3943 domain-containing protein [bacterium]
NPSWTEISCKTVKYNITHGFVWDSDGFDMNYLFHPFSGALSYTAARSRGLSFWKSIVYPFAGSLMWEIAMETERPSSNDLINTTASGIVMGEISFRTSSLMLNGATTGGKRMWREAAAGILSPMHGLNRLISGKSWRVNPDPPAPDYTISLSAGMLGLFEDRRLYQKQPHGFLKYHMTYGNPYTAVHGEPFDYFTAHFGLGFTLHNTIFDIYGSGLLVGKRIRLFDCDKSLVGIFKNYNYINTAIYRTGSASVGTGLLTNIPLSPRVSLKSFAMSSIILMGGVDSPYTQSLNRDYNLGPGIGGKTETSITLSDIGKLYASYDPSWVHVVSGAKGIEFVSFGRAGLQTMVNHTVGWAVEYLHYYHSGSYISYPAVRRNNVAFLSYVTVTF